MQKNKIFFSFVMPAYKTAFLKEAIESILNQSYPYFELIIVNDDSTEDVWGVVNSFEDDRIRYYKNAQNIGGKDLVAQWNHSISYASGEYLILASDDDLYAHDFLEVFVPLIESNPKSKVFRPRVRHIDWKGMINYVESPLPARTCPLEYLYYWIKGHIGSGIPFYIFRRDDLISQGGFKSFPLAWHSDDATVLSLADPYMVTTDKVLFSFRMSGKNISSCKNTSCMMKSKISATYLFRDWILSQLNQISSDNEDLQFMYNYIQSNLFGFLRARILGVAGSSPTKDGISSLFRLFLNNEITCRQFVGETRKILFSHN